MSLNTQLGIDPSDIPTILRPSPVQNDLAPNQSSRYYTFGKPHKEILNTYSELRDGYDLNVDLLYGAPSWTILWRHWDTIGPGKNLVSPDLGFDPYLPLAGREIMYVHSGGLEGVSSQMLRYKYDGLIKVSDVQLPGRNPKGKKDEK
jgi:1-aminocyclopropane-1-carboxylate deaminase/D-cysteine desulfhydrase-like pyridoxal-dependent ACC family enzyme